MLKHHHAAPLRTIPIASIIACAASITLPLTTASAQLILADTQQPQESETLHIPASTTAQKFTTLLTALDRDDATKRLTATDILIADPNYEPLIIDALRTDTLSLEQRIRLTSALRQRFIYSPRPAVGIQFNRTSGRLVLSKVYDTFPAGREGTLRVGDVILEYDGVPLKMETSVNNAQNINHLTADSRLVLKHTLSYNPGDTVHATIRRRIDIDNLNPARRNKPNAGGIPQGVIVADEIALSDLPPEGWVDRDVKIKLGSWRTLKGIVASEDTDTSPHLAEAWRIRANRMNIPAVTASVSVAHLLPKNIEWANRNLARMRLPAYPVRAAPDRIWAENLEDPGRQTLRYINVRVPNNFANNARNNVIIGNQGRGRVWATARAFNGSEESPFDDRPHVKVFDEGIFDDAPATAENTHAAAADVVARDLAALQRRLRILERRLTTPDLDAQGRTVTRDAIDRIHQQLAQRRFELESLLDQADANQDVPPSE